MAVQAQYPSNVLVLNRSEQERKEMEFPQSPSKFLDPSPTIFCGGGSGTNTRKRSRDAAALLLLQQQQQQQQMQQHVNSFISQQQQQQQQQQQVLQATTPAVMSLAQLQNRQLSLPPSPAPMVSTGLCLDFDGRRLKKAGQNQSSLLPPSSSSASPSSSSIASSLLSNELAAQMAQQHDEIERLLHAHGEELRRGLAEKRRRHYRAVVGAAEEAAMRRLREREAEAERAARRCAELEEQLARLRAESTAWQAKALADQAEAAALHAQLQRAAAAAAAAAAAEQQRQSGGGDYGGDGGAEDAESANVDPNRAEPDCRACRACRVRLASVVLLPCRHLCVCDACDLAAASCPLCLIGRTGSVHVCFS